MSRVWKPGDVALYEGVRVMFTGEFAADSAIDQEGDERYGGVWVDKHARPLVVIDPEDYPTRLRLVTAMREQLEATLRTSVDDAAVRRIAILMEDALHSLIEPPKPEEPLGLGAVVEDENGVRWTRTLSGQAHKRYWTGDTGTFQAHRTYADLNVVRVLSDGWAGEDR